MSSSENVPLHETFRDERVLDYLAVLWPDVSRRALTGAFANGRVRSGGQPVAMERRVGDLADLTFHGDPNTLERIPHSCGGPTHGDGGIELLHEDDRLAVLSKPSGVAVVPDRQRAGDSCLGFLIRRELTARRSKPPSEWIRYRIVHRIDRLTSGLLLVARTLAAERALSDAFEKRRVEKEYRVLVRGEVLAAVITVRCPIRPGRKGRMRAECGAGAKEAETRFEVLERYGASEGFVGATYLRALPRTGRTHQIRVHAWALGHPLLADPLYGAPDGSGEEHGVPLTLHAYRYSLPDRWPSPRSFVAPLSDQWRALLRALAAH